MMVPPVFAGGCALAAPVAAGGAALGFGDALSPELLHADAVSASVRAAATPGPRNLRVGMGDRGNVHTSGAGSDVPDKEQPQ
ncbi:hypothetical protein GCM10023205_70560 [Yinghuangia aomiensis]|uniref:Secreted protein n=1 Tax=Yinghuangia aomiensis TaxID=676205 RepID=A0ABP9I5V3_9ACTN